MQSEAFVSLVRPIQTTRTIIWIALNAAILLYVVVACFILGVPSTTTGAFSHPMALPLIVVAVAAAVAGRVLPTVMFPRQRVHDLFNRDADPRELARNPKTGSLDNERLSK